MSRKDMKKRHMKRHRPWHVPAGLIDELEQHRRRQPALRAPLDIFIQTARQQIARQATEEKAVLLHPPQSGFAYLDFDLQDIFAVGKAPTKQDCVQVCLRDALAARAGAAGGGDVHRLPGGPGEDKEEKKPIDALDAALGQFRGGLRGGGAMVLNVKVPLPVQAKWEPQEGRIVDAVDTALRLAGGYINADSNADPDSDAAAPPASLLTGPLRFAINETPAGSFVDLHSDRGMAGICSSFDCIKLWLFFPPTPANRAVFISTATPTTPTTTTTKTTTPTTHLERASPYMSPPLILHTRQSDTLLVPPGWFHATYTTRAGYLLGADFLTSNPLHVRRALEALADEWAVCAAARDPGDRAESVGLLEGVMGEVGRRWGALGEAPGGAPGWVRGELESVVRAEEGIAGGRGRGGGSGGEIGGDRKRAKVEVGRGKRAVEGVRSFLAVPGVGEEGSGS